MITTVTFEEAMRAVELYRNSDYLYKAQCRVVETVEDACIRPATGEARRDLEAAIKRFFVQSEAQQNVDFIIERLKEAAKVIN